LFELVIVGSVGLEESVCAALVSEGSEGLWRCVLLFPSQFDRDIIAYVEEDEEEKEQSKTVDTK